MEYRYETVKRYVIEHNLNAKCRERHLIDKRTYLSKYLRSKGETFQSIGKLFGLDHSTVMHAIKKYNDIHTSMDFVLNCTDLIINFPMVGDIADFRDTISKNNKVLLNLNSEEYLALQTYRIDNMIFTNENAIKHMIDNCNNF